MTSKTVSTQSAPLFAFTKDARHAQAVHKLVRMIEAAYRNHDAAGHVPREVSDLGDKFSELMRSGQTKLWNDAMALLHAKNEQRKKDKGAFLAKEARQASKIAKAQEAKKTEFDPFESKLGKLRLQEDSKPTNYMAPFEPVRVVLYNVDIQCTGDVKICLRGVDLSNAILKNVSISKADLTGSCFDGIQSHKLVLSDCKYDEENAPSFKGANLTDARFNNLRKSGDRVQITRQDLDGLQRSVKREMAQYKKRIENIRSLQAERRANGDDTKPGVNEPSIQSVKAERHLNHVGLKAMIAAAKREWRYLQEKALNFSNANVKGAIFNNCDLTMANFYGAKLYLIHGASRVTFQDCRMGYIRIAPKELEVIIPQRPIMPAPRPMPTALARYWQSIPAGGEVISYKARDRAAQTAAVKLKPRKG